MNILINASNIKSTGGKAVTEGILSGLKDLNLSHNIWFLYSKQEHLSVPQIHNMHIIERNHFIPRPLWRILDIFFNIKQICKREKIDVCFTLGDYGPSNLSCRHIVLFHNAWLICNDKRILKTLNFIQRIILEVHKVFFKKCMRSCERIFVQTDLFAHKLISVEKLPEHKITVIKQAAILPEKWGDPSDKIRHIYSDVTKTNFLVLSSYYPHKNMEVIPEMFDSFMTQDQKKHVRFILTVEESDLPVTFKRMISKYPENIIVVGRLTRNDIVFCLQSSAALFLPTLLESLGLPYLEAKVFSLPVITSDLDFAHDVCGADTFYFDPFNLENIYKTLTGFLNLNINRKQGKSSKMEFNNDSWEEIAKKYFDYM